jgi:hypothetical protein
MFNKSRSTPEPSFYHVMLAATSFRRTTRSWYPNATRALRDVGCKYLANAGCGVVHEQISEKSLVRTGCVGAKDSGRHPCKVD